jgi:predicted TIM-barrel fold metal-dependent hydrolase
VIVDCHHHVFQHWIGPCGHVSREVHAKYIQKMLTRTVAPVIRQRDGAPADTSALFRTGENGWSGLNDVDIRVGRFGQLEFTADGEDHVTQYMPVGMQEFVAPPELMLAQMAYVGVNHCILQAGGAYGAMTDYNAFVQHQHPDKATGLMWVDEATAGSPEGLADVERACRDLGLRGIYYNLEGFARYDFAWAMDDSRFDPFWEKLNDLGIILCIELSAGPSYDEAGYVISLRRLGRILNRFPELPCHLAMGPPVQYFARNGCWELPDEVTRVYRRDNVLVEVMFPITWGGVWDYPYPEARALIRNFRDQFGAEKMMWGSDMPNVERFCTYRQSLDYVRRYCEFLIGREMDLILGGNAARLYGLPRSQEHPDG